MFNTIALIKKILNPGFTKTKFAVRTVTNGYKVIKTPVVKSSGLFSGWQCIVFVDGKLRAVDEIVLEGVYDEDLSYDACVSRIECYIKQLKSEEEERRSSIEYKVVATI